MDSKAPKVPFADFALSETRFRMLQKVDPDRAKKLLAQAQEAAISRFDYYKQLAGLQFGSDDSTGEAK